MLRILLALAAVVGSALFLACGGDDDKSTATVTEAPTSTSVPASASPSPTKASTATATPEKTKTPVDMAVTLSEYKVVTDAASGPAGDYTFSIANEGPAEGHVFMIVKTDLAPEALPQTSNGQFAPSSAAVILANTPNIGPNASDSFSYDLEAGKYVFICNNVDAEGQGHYGKGMRTGFTVE